MSSVIAENDRTVADRPIESNFRFKHYASREAFKADTGEDPPPFDVTKAVKRWRDPNVKAISARSARTYLVLAVDALSGLPLTGPDGRPFTDELVMPAAEAAVVNLPPKDLTLTQENDPNLAPWPDPLKDLEPIEQLFFLHAVIGNQSVWIRNLTQYASIARQQAIDAGKFTAGDRAKLDQVAADVAQLLARG